MKCATVFLSLLALPLTAAAQLLQSVDIPPLPEPVTNNAVASVTIGKREMLVSFAGLGPGKEFADTHAHTWVFSSDSGQWSQGPDVPNGEGRLAAVATAIGDRIYVFGGYSVAADGAEVSTPYTHAFDPVALKFNALSPMPVPVDDAVAVAFANRYIYLISGWHDFGNVNLVQRYDTQSDRWSQATPTPGPSVFGHAGGIVDNTIVYCDGVAIRARQNERREFEAVSDCYLGIIDASDSRQIDWRVLPPHPGMARYRMAAAGVAQLNGVLFIGGSDNPYNYNGIGYDGEPSKPQTNALLLDVAENVWREISIDGTATMDHRGLVQFQGGWLTLGGMTSGQVVSPAVHRYATPKTTQ